jgi:Flp pilus assembly protein TadG
MHGFVKRARDDRGAERGFFMVWFALLFVTLLGFAGLALEYNRWQNISTRTQKAADAAALAGAVFLPDNLPQAQTTAKSTASKNGYTDGVAGVTITAAKARLPNQLKVTITVPTKNPWGGIVGYGNTTIARTAVAEYQLPQNLGSPENRYGNNPESPPAGGQPQFWGNIFGPASVKGKGDAYQAALCGGGVDNCPSGGTNADYDPNGYFYGIEVPAGSTGALNVQVFDPAYVQVGDNCTDGDAVNSLNKAATLTNADIPGHTTDTITPATRYASGSTSPYCTGDMSYYSDSNNNLNPWTTWTLRAPDTSGWDPTNNPIVCQAEFPGVFPERTTDLPNSGTVDSNHLSDLLKQSTNYPGVTPAMRFNDFFRRWVTLCSIANPTSGTYFLQVQTNKKIDGSAAPNGGGANRWAIQVGLGTDYTTANNLRLYGNGRMGVYANATGADTRFYLTRILPGEAGKVLVLQFFDTGDASAAGDITVLPPPDSNVSGGAFTSCKYTPPAGSNSTGPPWGTLTDTATGCKVTGVSSGAGWDGQWTTYEIPIPATYDCDDTSPTGCWTRLRFTYPPGTTVNDTTSWVAYVLGEPVRLIQ